MLCFKILCQYLVFCSVNICHSSMSKKKIVANYVRLSCRVSSLAEEVKKDGAPSWSKETRIISLCGDRVRFVECSPMLHSVAEFLKACLCVGWKVQSDKGKKTKKLVSYLSSIWFFLLRIRRELMYMIWGSSHPLYLSTKAWGRSQW